MNVEDFRNYCLSLPHVTEKMPFTTVKGPYSRDVLCFYIGSKWFCYVNIEVFDRCCLKSKPDIALELRARYNGIRPAWHMNKRHWNDVYFNQDVPDAMIRESRIALSSPHFPKRNVKYWKYSRKPLAHVKIFFLSFAKYYPVSHALRKSRHFHLHLDIRTGIAIPGCLRGITGSCFIRRRHDDKL